MAKKTVFFGIYGKYRIGPTMEDVLKQLCSRGISYIKKNVHYAGFETPHVHVRFVCSGDDYDDLCGLRADAVFGAIWDVMIKRMNPGADNWRKLDINLIDYICMVEREAEIIRGGYTIDANRPIEKRVTDTWIGDMWPKTYITTSGIGGNDEFRKRWLNSIYGKGVPGLRQMYVPLDEMSKHKDESLYNRAILMMGRRNGKYPLSSDVIREMFEHAEKAGVLKPTLRKIPEITQADIDRLLDTDPLIQLKIYNAISKGENTMAQAEKIYIQQDVANVQKLAETFRNLNNAFNRKFPGIKNVIFSGPCTIVMWEDGTKTVVRCEKDVLDPEKGLAMAIAKKALGTNKSGSNYYDIFKKWLPKDEPMVIDYADTKKDDATCQE